MTVYIRTIAKSVAAAEPVQIGVDGASATQGTGTQAITVPGTPSNGDRLIFVASARSVSEDASVTWTDPSGATVVGTVEPTGGFFPRVRVWETDYDGTTSYTFGSNLSGQTCAIVTLDDAGAGVSLSSGATGNAATNEPDPDSIGTGDKSLVLAVCVGNTTLGGVSAPSGYTEQVDTTADGNRGMSIASKEVASATTEDPGEFTSATSTTWHALSIAIEPTDVA